MKTTLSRARNQAGVAVITVLMVVAIGSALAYALASQQAMVMSQSRHVLVGDALRNLLLGGEVLAKQMLFKDWEEDKDKSPATDNLNEEWAQSIPPFEIPGGFIEVQARDLHSCLNLNALEVNGPKLPEGKGVTNWVKKLFPFLELDAAFADRWQDWIDRDKDVNGFGAEDAEYDGRDVPFRTANAPAGHISELRLLGEIEFEQWQELQKIACVAPPGTLMNVNTLTPELLGLFNDKRVGINDEIEEVEEGGYPEWDSVENFFNNTDLPKGMDSSIFTLQSSYFEISIRAELDGETASMVSTLYRDLSDGKITVLGRDFSRRFVSRYDTETTQKDS